MLKFQYSGWAAGLLAIALGTGWAGRQGAGGYYRVEARQGIEWLVSPAGDAGVLLGVNHVHLISASAPATDLAPAYIDQRATAIVAGLRHAGFNALGGDTDADVWHRGLPYIENLDLSRHLQADQQTPMVDVFAAGFTARLASLVQTAAAPRALDPDLIGYVSDDGLNWDPNLHAGDVLTYFLQLPLDTPGRQRAVNFLRERYGSDIRRLNRAWGVKTRDFLAPPPPAAGNAAWRADAAAFGAAVLARYLQGCADAIHSADPNHLYLGANLHFRPGTSLGTPGADDDATLVWAIPDVTSVELDASEDAAAAVQALRQLSSRPLLIEVSGCGAVAQPEGGVFGAATLIGYVWSPTGDWQSGACAAQAAAVWTRWNQRARAAHAAAR